MALKQTIRFCKARDGVRLAYATSGKGAPLVIVGHSLGHIEFEAKNPVWGRLVEQLGEDHTVLRYDRRGTGLSDRQVSVCFDDWVDDLQHVLDAAGIGDCTLLGVSEGAGTPPCKPKVRFADSPSSPNHRGNQMTTTPMPISTPAPLAAEALSTRRYAKCIEMSKRVRWEIERDVLRGRTFDLSSKYLPDGLSLVHELTFLTPPQKLFLSQIQGRTYANMFGLVERFIGAKMLEVSRDHWFGDQVALEAIVRFSDEEMKHQELFRRIELLCGAAMPAGYVCDIDPNDLAKFVLGKSTWSVLARTCHIELFTQVHYRESIRGAAGLSELLGSMTTDAQMARIQSALGPLMSAVPAHRQP